MSPAVLGAYSLAFLGSIVFASAVFMAVRKLWRYQGTDVSGIMPHLSMSEEDKLSYARASPSALLVVMMMPILLGLMVLRAWILVLWGIDWNIDAAGYIAISLICLGGLFVLLTWHLHWPKMLIPPAFRGSRARFPWSNR